MPFFAVLFYFIFERRSEKWLLIRIDISDRQLDQDLENMKTFDRIYLQFYQNYMQSFIGFVLWFNLNSLSVLIILDEYRGIVDKCALNRATDLLPGVLFVIELESYDKNDHFVNVHGDVPLLCQSL